MGRVMVCAVLQAPRARHGTSLEKVVPRLLLPLQSDGRVLKPCLIHGDCWDGNTATCARTGEAFVFDVCSFYGHNEYDIGN